MSYETELMKKEIEYLKNEINNLKNQHEYEVVAYARINDRGNLFDLRLFNNPYVDQKTVVPLFRIK
jgi:hypothetical protein